MSTLIPDAPVVACTTRYRVTFERIGRVQAVAPLEVEASTADWLAQTIHAAAARHLPSRTFESCSTRPEADAAGLAAHMRMPAAETGKALREAAYALRRLVDGDLAGMFDGPTTGGIDLEAPLVAFDLSRVTDTTSLGVVMICVSAWLRRLLADSDDGVRRIIVYDEAWKVLRVPGVARFLNESWKMARQWGVQNVAVMHRLSDLASVGDAGSEAIELAKGLLSDSQTRVVYQQASNELGNLRELLQLNAREVAEHLVSQAERWIVDTEPREEAAPQ